MGVLAAGEPVSPHFGDICHGDDSSRPPAQWPWSYTYHKQYKNAAKPRSIRSCAMVHVPSSGLPVCKKGACSTAEMGNWLRREHPRSLWEEDKMLSWTSSMRNLL